MTLDPEFRFDDGIERVSNVHDATQVSLCDAEHFLFDAPTELELPDGRRLALSPGRVQDADAYCRARGASGVDRGGCTAALGSSASARSTGALLTSVLAALLWRAPPQVQAHAAPRRLLTTPRAKRRVTQLACPRRRAVCLTARCGGTRPTTPHGSPRGGARARAMSRDRPARERAPRDRSRLPADHHARRASAHARASRS
jgi:hypothetical protein